MNGHHHVLLALLLSPVILFSQQKNDSILFHNEQTSIHHHIYQDDSTFSILLNTSTLFYTARDARINRWLSTYGYRPQQSVPQGIQVELAAVPFNSRMMFAISGGTIISRQDIVTSNFTIGVYRRMLERKKYWLLAGAGIGKHGDRVVLNGRMPPAFDSLAQVYNKTLSLHRGGLLVEPAVRFLWYPVQTKKIQLGFFASTAYDFSFNTRWKLGYYNQNGQFTSFKRIRKPADVQTQEESGFVFGAGLSCCFKFN